MAALRRASLDASGVAWLGAAVAAMLLPFVLGASALTTATFVVIAAIGVSGLNVLTGYAGQISIGQAFFLAVGAYTGAVLGADLGLSAALWIPAAGATAAIVGALVGPLALRLRGLYLAIVTMGLVFLGQHVLLNSPGLSGGPQGRAFPAVVIGPFDFSAGQELELGGVVIDRTGLYYYLALALLGLALAFSSNLAHSRVGRAMHAVRQGETVAAVMGVVPARTKVTAFVAASFMAGVGGALYASYLSYAQPGQWSLHLSIQYIAAMVIGGMGTIAGPVLGAAVVFALPSLLSGLPFTASDGAGGLTANALATILYGLLIVVFLIVEPRGLAGIGERVTARIRIRPARASSAGRRFSDAPAPSTTEEGVS
jgi:branched-chain amino acid transport system permease protein